MFSFLISRTGRRRAGISQLVSANGVVPSAELLNNCRHKSALTNATYQAANEDAHAKRYEATMYNGGKENEVS